MNLRGKLRQHHIGEINPRKKKIIITAVIAAAIVLLVTIIAVASHTQKEKRFQRDFGEVFSFDFEMDIEDIIVYEALTFGNIDYEFDSDANRLDFAEDDDGEYKHRYFFSDETGLLTSAYFIDRSIGEFDAGDADECEHIKPFKNALWALSVWVQTKKACFPLRKREAKS